MDLFYVKLSASVEISTPYVDAYKQVFQTIASLFGTGFHILFCPRIICKESITRIEECSESHPQYVTLSHFLKETKSAFNF